MVSYLSSIHTCLLSCTFPKLLAFSILIANGRCRPEMTLPIDSVTTVSYFTSITYVVYDWQLRSYWRFSMCSNGGFLNRPLRNDADRKWHHQSISLPQFCIGLLKTVCPCLTVKKLFQCKDLVWISAFGPKNGGFRQFRTSERSSENKTPKWHFLEPNCLVWAIVRQNRSSGLICRTIHEKVW